MADIPEKMLAAQVVEFHKPYKIQEVPVPGKNLDENDMLVKVAVGSLCHTDGMVLEGIMGTKLPCIGSHEGAGTVVKVGSAISEFKVGDRILVNLTYHRCRTCADCKGPEQDTQYCANVGGYLGVSRDGSFAEYELVDGRECCRLPDNVSFQSAAPLACAGATVWGGLVRAGLKSGESIAIVGGGGGLGHLGVQFAKALGLRVIAIDARDEGLALAKECGADTTVDARKGKEKVVEEVKKVTNGKLADATLNVSDHESAAATGAAVTKMHGILLQIAQPTNVSVPFEEFVFRDIRVHGSLICSRGECQKMLEVVSKNNIKVKTNAFKGIKEVPKAVELAHSGKMQGKPVILIDERAIEDEKRSGLKMI
ncbi:GroES-like protein [Mollisia scopiformis]|uniref:GroES-like protein n=1 Tax=Mollisia scopiformis TaxID=149040 RepID=A0A194XQB2_MOLSC|nr:GroES-like protein [Mollisia scopiformis]KUJ22351.1 GroES-like protein [Mollisia scopiformis]